ncbi:hypothetical protein [Comamonas composti]|uniref:hypothetical protein n=1 Tax=Comamonas composti TaxID=408558 RepID=UPI00146FB894|nr:hypothetical protein [Comamonas composti]
MRKQRPSASCLRLSADRAQHAPPCFFSKVAITSPRPGVIHLVRYVMAWMMGLCFSAGIRTATHTLQAQETGKKKGHLHRENGLFCSRCATQCEPAFFFCGARGAHQINININHLQKHE